MTTPLTLLILRIGFLLVLWLFIFAVMYALRSDLFGAPVRKLKGDSGATPVVSSQPGASPTAAPLVGADAVPTAAVSPITPSGGALPSAGGTGPARTLVITSGVASGTAIPLDESTVTIGRSGDSTLVIVDEYTSTYHARLSLEGDYWILTDLGSTNGTKLDGVRLTDPAPVPMFTPVTIGTTTFELRP